MSDDHAEHVAEQSRQYYTALQQQTQQSASVPAQEPGAAAGAPADDEAARRAQRAEQYYTQLYHRDVARLVDALYDRDVARLQLALSVTQAEVRHVWEVLRLACELGHDECLMVLLDKCCPPPGASARRMRQSRQARCGRPTVRRAAVGGRPQAQR